MAMGNVQQQNITESCFAIPARVTVQHLNVRQDFGAPMTRRRIYIILIKEDVLHDEAAGMDFHTYIKNKLEEMHLPKANMKWFLVVFLVL